VKNSRNIFLIGFSGSGKSTVGPGLARALKVGFHDTDELIASREGRPVPETLDVRGEEYFRRVESSVIREVIGKYSDGMVVALGGGAFEDSRNRDMVLGTGLVVYLSCSVRGIYRRLAEKNDRPLLRVREQNGETVRQARLRRIKQLLSIRAVNYAKADIRFATTGREVEATVAELLERIRKHCAEN
jgi:shikimate kinase